MRTLAIDPGLSGLGVALFEDAELVQAWYSPGPSRKRPGGFGRDGAGNLLRGPRVWRDVANSIAWLNDDAKTRPDRLIVETMKVYTGRAGGSKDANDLLELQGVLGCVVATFPYARVAGLVARDWKGQVPKPVMLARIQAWINARAWGDRVVEAGALTHNAIDAAGLGMVALRLEGKLRQCPFDAAH